MGLTFIQANSSGITANSASVAITATAGSVFLIYGGNLDSSAAISDSVGNAYQLLGTIPNGGILRMGWLAKNATTGAVTITLADAGQPNVFFFVAEYSGENVSPLDVVAIVPVTLSNPISRTLITSFSNESLFWIGRNNYGGTEVFNDGSTSRAVPGGSGGAFAILADRPVAVAGQQTFSLSITTGTVSVEGMVVALKSTTSALTRRGWVNSHRSFVNLR